MGNPPEPPPPLLYRLAAYIGGKDFVAKSKEQYSIGIIKNDGTTNLKLVNSNCLAKHLLVYTE